MLETRHLMHEFAHRLVARAARAARRRRSAHSPPHLQAARRRRSAHSPPHLQAARDASAHNAHRLADTTLTRRHERHTEPQVHRAAQQGEGDAPRVAPPRLAEPGDGPGLARCARPRALPRHAQGADGGSGAHDDGGARGAAVAPQAAGGAPQPAAQDDRLGRPEDRGGEDRRVRRSGARLRRGAREGGPLARARPPNAAPLSASLPARRAQAEAEKKRVLPPHLRGSLVLS